MLLFDKSPKYYYYGNRAAVVSVRQLQEVYLDARKGGEDTEINYRKSKLFVKNLTRVSK